MPRKVVPPGQQRHKLGLGHGRAERLDHALGGLQASPAWSSVSSISGLTGCFSSAGRDAPTHRQDFPPDSVCGDHANPEGGACCVLEGCHGGVCRRRVEKR